MMLTGIKNSILDMGLFANKWGHCNKERSCFTASEMFSISNYRYLFISFPASFHIFSSKKKTKNLHFPRCLLGAIVPSPIPCLSPRWLGPGQQLRRWFFPDEGCPGVAFRDVGTTKNEEKKNYVCIKKY